MKISRGGFSFEITRDDLAKMRDAIRQWKADPEISENFNGGTLYDHFQRWQKFVDTDWEGWDISEYNHDIGCRAWIQLAIENSTVETAMSLENEVSRIDDKFKVSMKPFQKEWLPVHLKKPFKHGPYFWETHTIHAEYWE